MHIATTILRKIFNNIFSKYLLFDNFLNHDRANFAKSCKPKLCSVIFSSLLVKRAKYTHKIKSRFVNNLQTFDLGCGY